MIKFLEGDAISAKIIQTIKEADEYLIFISPYIKLTEKIKTEIKHLVKQRPEVEIEVVFGKNEHKTERSLSLADYEFFKSLPNIRISYVRELHAKIYCSEDRLMLSSMNLHSYSQANNFEAAFVIEDGKTLVSAMVNITSNTAWNDALDFVNKIVASSVCLYKIGKVYKSKYLGFSTEIVEEFFEDNSANFYKIKSEPKKNMLNGYCIRTGIEIPFDTKKPYCNSAYKSWQHYKNPVYKEKYCHYSGEISEGETSFKAPILEKNGKLAKSKFGF